MKKGWVTVNGESLSPFHRQLIATFPHYASAAVVGVRAAGEPGRAAVRGACAVAVGLVDDAEDSASDG